MNLYPDVKGKCQSGGHHSGFCTVIPRSPLSGLADMTEFEVRRTDYRFGELPTRAFGQPKRDGAILVSSSELLPKNVSLGRGEYLLERMRHVALLQSHKYVHPKRTQNS